MKNGNLRRALALASIVAVVFAKSPALADSEQLSRETVGFELANGDVVDVPLAEATAVLGMAPPVPEDYECRRPECFARKSKHGKLVTKKFRKGDLVSTEDGWVAPKEHWIDGGWRKVNSGPVVGENRSAASRFFRRWFRAVFPSRPAAE